MLPLKGILIDETTSTETMCTAYFFIFFLSCQTYENSWVLIICDQVDLSGEASSLQHLLAAKKECMFMYAVRLF